ncbi:MAG TPA: TIGR04282 family arsenosugar biosynthesis glycosyltransferase [Pyrinomonadaceae bacterium]|jgi:hypothetical protein
MAKAPRAGEAKTRLTPPLAPREAARLASCFFADTVSLALGVGAEVVVAYAPAGGRAALEAALRRDAPRAAPRGDAPGAALRGGGAPEDAPGVLRWVEQPGGGLGERLAGVAEGAFAEGLGPLLLVGADSPTLPPGFLAAALDALASGRADAALGPADDGGYYAVGLRAPAPGLFDAVEWSTPRAYEQTARNAARLGLRLFEAPRWYDVDTASDLLRLRAELDADEEARRRAPATRRWMTARFG